MKKIFLLLTGLFFVSCSSVKVNKTSEAKITLTGNPSAGYSWELSEDSADNASVSVSEAGTVYLGADGILGAPSRFDFTLSPKGTGSTVLVFDYSRPFEKDVPPLERALFDVEVQDNGITLKSSFAGNWKLSSIIIKDNIYQPVLNVDLVIDEFDADKYLIGGSAGVNVFNTDIEVIKNKARVSDNFALTKMLGSEEEMAFEQMYISMFTGELYMYTYKVNETQRLVIENPSKNMTAFYAFNQEKL